MHQHVLLILGDLIAKVGKNNQGKNIVVKQRLNEFNTNLEMKTTDILRYYICAQRYPKTTRNTPYSLTRYQIDQVIITKDEEVAIWMW